MINIKSERKPNQLRAILAMTKVSVLSSLRNPSMLFFSFFFPFVFISIFGLLGQGNQSFQIGLREESLRSGTFYEALTKVDVLKFVTDKKDSELDDQLKKGQIAVVLDIQNDGEVAISPNVKIPRYKIDIEKSAAAPQEVQTISVILDNVVSSFNTAGIPSQMRPINVSTSIIEGRKFQQIDFILPGQLAFALLTNALFGIGFAFVTMKKELIIKRIFATPVNRGTIIISEVLGKFVIAIAQALLIILVGHFVFDFTLAHGVITVINMVILSLIGIFVFLSFGIFAAAISKSEDSLSPIANLIMMPQMFLSGAFFPIELFPSVIQPIAKILPMTFLNEAFKKVAFEGAPLSDTLPMIVGLLVWASIMYTIDAKLFRWE